MKVLKNIIFLFAVIFFSSCVEQMVMIPEVEVPGTERVVLLEDLTGVACSNCPAASTIAKEITERFPGKVVVVGVHGDLLCEPKSTSKYDFRFEEAADVENYLRPWFGKPAGAINRTQFEGETELSISIPEQWQSLVQEELLKPHVMDLVAEVTYDEVTRSIGVSAGATPVVDLEGTYNMTVMLTESHIIDPQDNKLADGSVITIEDYEHNHVLRMMMTTFDGESLGTNLSEGDLLNKTFSATLPEEDGTWIADNMEVVVFVNRVDTGFKTVVQAFQTHLVE